MRPRLGFCVDGVAALRQLRRGDSPDPVEAALVAERAGVDQICARLLQDRRHVQDRDLFVLRQVVKTELVVCLAPVDAQVEVALSVSPDTVLLGPDPAPGSLSEGLDLVQAKEGLQRQVRTLLDAKLRVAAAVEPTVEQIRAAHRLGLHAVELSCAVYVLARGFTEQSHALARLRDAAKLAAKLGLGVGAAGGLGRKSVAPLCRIGEIQEVNVGHSLCADAVVVGLDRAVRDLLSALEHHRA